MEEPPNQPEPPPPPGRLGPIFWLAFVAPIIVFVVALSQSNPGPHPLTDSRNPAMKVALGLAVAAVIVCSIITANRYGDGMGCLIFFGLIFLYGAIAFAGCLSQLRW